MQNDHPSRALALAPWIGTAISAAIYLSYGLLFGADPADLLPKVMYGVGMCATATVTATLVLPLLVRRRKR